MKRRLVVCFVILTMIVTSCKQVDVQREVVIDASKDEKINDQVSLEVELEDNNAQDGEEDSIPNENQDKEIDEKEPIVSGWNMNIEEIMVEVAYEPSVFEVVEQPLSILDQYESIINAGQYSGFTQGQEEMLKENGFVVINQSSKLKMHTFYEYSEYMDLPIFITSDAVLHMYRTFYAESMKTLEMTAYYEEVKQMTQDLLEQVDDVYNESDEEVKKELAYSYAYFAVAASLLGLETDLPEEVGVMVDSELSHIEDLSMMHSDFYDKDVDYSQYTVRGHYTLHEILTQYFRAMMWYGQTGFQLTKEIDGVTTIQYDQVRRSMMTTELLFADENIIESWNMLYGLTKLYSGYSDDLNLYDMKAFIEVIYGDDHGYDIYMDSSYEDAIAENIHMLRGPSIAASATNNVDIPSGLQFRMMGQRYSLDADIMQNLMEPIARPVPTAFDVLSAFEHPVAEEVLYKYYKTNQEWEGYDDKLALMKEKVKDYDQWQSNFYNGWLWAIDSAATSFEGQDDYPYFMQTRAWSHKSLSSALGSYAQLKHDNILYGKQPVAEMGGAFYEEQEYHYVEPTVDLYEKLLWLTKYTKANLENRDQFNEDMIQPIVEIEEMLKVLVDVSKKELAGEMVTDKEFNTLSGIGGLIDYLNFVYSRQLYDQGIEVSRKDTDAVIADVATIFGPGGDGNYLEEAVGLPKDIYTVCYVNDKAFLARGTVFSYYEFLSQERLTDEKWLQMVGLEIVKHDGYNTTAHIEEEVELLELMPWMKSYISDEPNSVQSTEVEVRWGD